MPLIETKGAASAQGFGLTLQQTAVNYIEDVFSTWLYTGTGVSQTITNGIDLSTKGGLVWTKARSSAFSNGLVDTARGTTNTLISNATDASDVYNTVTAFNTNGFTVGTSAIANGTGTTTMVSWTFRKQPKFFDVVTWTGTGASPQWVSHSLGVVPGCVIIKATSGLGNWFVVHRSTNGFGILQTDQGFAGTTFPGISASSPWLGATTTQIEVQNFSSNGVTYVAYLFAHNAGGFGLTGTDNVISCGSFTTDASSKFSVSLGYEPQWLLLKSTSQDFPESWYVVDTMRGFAQEWLSTLSPNSSNAEVANNSNYIFPTATGFQTGTQTILGASREYIYIAIRRGPMKTPTTGTSVFSPVAQTSTANQLVTTNFPVDLLWTRARPSFAGTAVFDRLRGSRSTGAVVLNTNSANGESSTGSYGFGFDNNTGVTDNFAYGISAIYWNFRRAPGFCDVVCYTGTGSATTFSHNLGVVPELMMVKRRDLVSANWFVYDTATGNTKYQVLNNTATPTTSSAAWNNTTPTSTVFSVGTDASVNASAGTYVAYLFASCPGVSKVGSYTGTAALLTVNCGFTGGARFVLIKRTDGSTVAGDWWVYDSARGISSGNDPYLLLNSTSPEVTGTNYVDTTSVGFQVTAAAPAGLNANGGTYIFLAIA